MSELRRKCKMSCAKRNFLRNYIHFICVIEKKAVHLQRF